MHSSTHLVHQSVMRFVGALASGAACLSLAVSREWRVDLAGDRAPVRAQLLDGMPSLVALERERRPLQSSAPGARAAAARRHPAPPYRRDRR